MARFFALSIWICVGEVQNQFLQLQWLTKWLHETAIRRRNSNRRRKMKKTCEVTQNERIVWIANMTFDQRFRSAECLQVENHAANDWFDPMIDNKIPNSIEESATIVTVVERSTRKFLDFYFRNWNRISTVFFSFHKTKSFIVRTNLLNHRWTGQSQIWRSINKNWW